MLVLCAAVCSCGPKATGQQDDSGTDSTETEDARVVVSDDEQEYALEKTYSTKFYSIRYPGQWIVLEHLNEMTDAYIGEDDFGFTIVRFETDYSLDEANAEGNENIRKTGIKISEEKQLTVDGEECYRAVHEIAIPGHNVKHVSYTFKKGFMLYNIKFGDVSTKAREAVASDIIKSFRFK